MRAMHGQCPEASPNSGRILTSSLPLLYLPIPGSQADVLLSQGFHADVSLIAQQLPVRCQCMLLTATFRWVQRVASGSTVLRLAKAHCVLLHCANVVLK